MGWLVIWRMASVHILVVRIEKFHAHANKNFFFELFQFRGNFTSFLMFIRFYCV
uniref:Uncharacterized protein n=1 Tax=Ascaris lumbricoides TaxID=6252 RepID=A0A0M3ITT6_ASCLU